MSRKVGSWVLWGLMGVAVVSVIAAVVRHSVQTNPKVARLAEEGIPVRVVPARMETLEEVIGASGEVEPISYTKLTALVEAKIESVKVDLGDITEIDQDLLLFDATVIRAAFGSAEDNLSKTRTAMENGRLHLQRLTQLFKEKLIARADMEEAQLKFDTAKAQYSDAVQRLTQAQDDLKHTTVKSPIVGIVTERVVNPGETPKAGAALLTLGRLDSVLMAARVAEEKLASVSLGQSAEVRFDAFLNEMIEGKILKIDPKIDSKTRTFIAYIKLANLNLKFKPGMTGFARIKKLQSGLAVPSVAINNPVKDQAALFVVDQSNTAHLRSVKIGLMANGMTQVISGVEEGDLVVTAGLLGLKDRDRVRIGTEKFE